MIGVRSEEIGVRTGELGYGPMRCVLIAFLSISYLLTPIPLRAATETAAQAYNPPTS